MVGADDIIYPQYILRHRDHFGDRQSVSRGLIQQFAATAAYSVAETAAPEVEMIAYIKRRRQSRRDRALTDFTVSSGAYGSGGRVTRNPQSSARQYSTISRHMPSTASKRRLRLTVSPPNGAENGEWSMPSRRPRIMPPRTLPSPAEQIAHVTVVTLMSVVLSECDTVEYMWRTRKHHPVLARGHCIYHHGKLLFPQRYEKWRHLRLKGAAIMACATISRTAYSYFMLYLARMSSIGWRIDSIQL